MGKIATLVIGFIIGYYFTLATAIASSAIEHLKDVSHTPAFKAGDCVMSHGSYKRRIFEVNERNSYVLTYGWTCKDLLECDSVDMLPSRIVDENSVLMECPK